MEVTRLGAGDVDRFRQLNRLFSDVFEDPESYSAKPPNDAYTERLLRREEFIALSATVGGELAGCLAAYELVKYEQQRSEIYIYDLAVRDEFRRRGVATALIEALKPIAQACRAWMIYVQADPPDAPAVALYDKLGLREEVFHFDISPDGGPPPTG
ncbi:MAG: AAC(3)-I family aminoglycoside N-acetyltransferase [Pseudomonadota bacterium]|nr:AAC(3)-I family aminoglycoside N-acetyltransferase [Pseudomonadota bacterium]